MTEKQQKLRNFLKDRKNWRPPSYSQIMAYMGWSSKNSVHKALKKIKWTLNGKPTFTEIDNNKNNETRRNGK